MALLMSVVEVRTLRERRRSDRAVHGGSGWEGASHLATQVVRCQGRVSYVEACCARGRRRRRNSGGIGAEDRYGAEEPDANPHPEAEPTLQSRHPELLRCGSVWPTGGRNSFSRDSTPEENVLLQAVW